ncbi:hypothetical protein MMC13_001125 [Lambiella insularis]|nr:hypothetical protein [Lambiella insularis]
MRFSTIFVPAALVQFGIASYAISDSYSASTFFDMFTFSTANDPTSGYVNFVDQSTAQSSGLISTSNGQIKIGVDSTSIASGRGRNSVRLGSKKTYNHGLVVMDLAHMPGGICGTWPAFWTANLGSWPQGGEIDIIEGVNDQSTNSMTCHTSAGCANTSPANMFTGHQATSDCNVKSPTQTPNQGCSTSETASASFGAGFNSNGGGIYAMEWTSQYVQIFFWPRGTAPNDVTSGKPDPSSWGKPAFLLQGGCDIDNSFKDHQIIFDTTFCGVWAGKSWGGSCAAQHGSSCNAFVQNNPSAFADAYWLINSLNVYSMDAATPASQSAIAAAPVQAAVTVTAPAVRVTVAPQPLMASDFGKGSSGIPGGQGRRRRRHLDRLVRVDKVHA